MRFFRLSAVFCVALLGLPVQAAGQASPLSEVFPLWWPETIESYYRQQATSSPGFPVAAALRHGFALAVLTASERDDHAVEGRLVDLSGQPGPKVPGRFVGPGFEPYFADPAIGAVGPDGFVLAWAQHGDYSAIVYRRFAPRGVPLGDLVFLAEERRGDFCAPVVAGNSSGAFAIAWEGYGCSYYGLPTAISVRAFSASGEAATAELDIPMPESPGVSGMPRVGIDAAGRFVVLWRQAGATETDPAKLCGQAYGVRGGFLGAPFCIGELAGSTGGALAVDPAGSFLAAWFGPAAAGAQAPLFVRRYQMNGTPLGNPVQVAAAADPIQLTASGDGHGNAVLAWREGDQIRLLPVRRDAVAQGPAVTVTRVPQDAFTFGVALADSGRLLVTWWSGDLVLGQLWQARF